jgi:acid phosphatase family membrane protein YuiD
MICAQGMKPFTARTDSDRIPWWRITQSGGMPSSHSAVVAALATSLGLEHGWASPAFQVAAVLGGIVIYDAITLRRVVGEHTRVLKERFQGVADNTFLWENGVGHTPLEASVGLLLGVLCAVLVVRV